MQDTQKIGKVKGVRLPRQVCKKIFKKIKKLYAKTIDF